jgi:hypothetical protein
MGLGGSLDLKVCGATPLGSEKLIKYGCLPFEEWLRNNQLATASRARKGTRRQRCPEDMMAMAPLRCNRIKEGIQFF